MAGRERSKSALVEIDCDASEKDCVHFDYRLLCREVCKHCTRNRKADSPKFDYSKMIKQHGY